MNFQHNKGMSFKSIIVIIAILAIFVTIIINSLNKMIEKQELESLKTNMLIIQAKAKEYCENAKNKLGTTPTDESKQNAKQYLDETGSIYYESLGLDINKFNIEDTEYLYLLTKDNFDKMGLNEIESNEKSGYYFIKYNIESETVEVYNSKGYTKDGITYYSLSDMIQNL